MTFLELARTRQSDRAFTTQAVSREDLLTCVQAAQLAPSACNSQPWKFVIIDDAVKAVLGLPEDRNVFIMLAVGYPSGNTRTKVRKEVDKICSFNRYEG